MLPIRSPRRLHTQPSAKPFRPSSPPGLKLGGGVWQESCRSALTDGREKADMWHKKSRGKVPAGLRHHLDDPTLGALDVRHHAVERFIRAPVSQRLQNGEVLTHGGQHLHWAERLRVEANQS